METQAVLEMLQDVAERVITPRFRALAVGEVMEKRPGDLVTVADREAEVEITAALRAAFPDALVVGEEAVSLDRTILDAVAGADHWFTVDPIDGTRNFVHGSPDHAVMVGEVYAGQQVRSWIWQPEHDVAWVAEAGAGVWRNGSRVTRPLTSPDPRAWRGRASQPIWRGEAVAGLAPLQDTAWCCGVDYPDLVAGEVDFLLYSHSALWDHVPGQLMLAEVGGGSAWIDGRPWTPAVVRSPLVAGAAWGDGVAHGVADPAAAGGGLGTESGPIAGEPTIAFEAARRLAPMVAEFRRD